MKRHELITEILKLTGHKRSLHPDVHFGIQRLLNRFENKWISIKDKLPEQGEYVWIYSPNEGFETQKQRSVRYDRNDYLWSESIITHWMPLPKPPKS